MLLDTHVLLWWALDPDKLSSAALESIARVEQHGGFASSISIWELGIKVKRGKLELPLTIQQFTRRLERTGVIELLPVSTSIWLHSLELPWDHSDPADRVIVATALAKGTPLITRDETIRAFPGVTTIW